MASLPEFSMNIRHYESGYTYELFSLLFTAGSIPYRYLRFYDASLETLRKLIRKFVKEGIFIRGKYAGTNEPAILLCPEAQLPDEVFDAFGKACFEYYHTYAIQDRDRVIHRDGSRAEKNAEIIMMARAAGIPVFWDEKPAAEGNRSLAGRELFYSAREYKYLNSGDYNESMTKEVLKNGIQIGRVTNQKMMGARINGLFVSDTDYSYAVYVVGKASMQWSRRGEKAAMRYANARLRERGRGIQEVTEAVFTYTGDRCLWKVFDPSVQRPGYLRASDSTYEAMYFLPRTRIGTAMLTMMRNKGWQSRIRQLCITEAEAKRGNASSYECDGRDEDGRYLLVFCVPDLKRLYNFYRIMYSVIYKQNHSEVRFKIFCFDFQRDFIEKAFERFDAHCEIKEISFWLFRAEYYGDE